MTDNKKNILRAIDDAVSKMSSKHETKSRASNAQRTARSILENNYKSRAQQLTEKDLASLNQYEHSTVKTNPTMVDKSVGRSVKSEFDYGSKRKFTDVLGNIQKTKRGLEELEQFEKKLNALDSASHRSARSSLAGS